MIFITPYQHRISNDSVHKAPKNPIWVEVKKIGQATWMEHYNKTKEDFIREYGKNYL